MLNKLTILIILTFVNLNIFSQKEYCIYDTGTYLELYDTKCGGDFADVEKITFTFPSNTGNIHEGIVQGINGDINLNLIYQTNTPNNQGIVYSTIKYYRTNIWGNDVLLCNTNIVIQGDSHLSFNVPENVCQGDGFDLFNYTSHSIGTFNTSNDTYLTGQGTDEIVFPPNAHASTFTINWDVSTNGCDFTKTDNLEIRANPVVTFPNIQSGQLLDSDNTPIQLTSTTDITVQQKWYFGAGINNSNQLVPSNAGYGTHTLTVDAQTLYGCSGSASQNVTITHDAGTPTPPEISNHSSGFGIKDHSFNLNGEPVYSRAFHVCNGQQLDIYIDTSSVQLGYDSVIVEYLFNGNPIQIGTYAALDHIQYTIPQTFGVRRDYLRTKFKTNLGVIGAIRTSEVYINAPNQRVNFDTICNGSPVFPILGYNTNIDYDHLYWGQGGYYGPPNASTFETEFFDLFNNPLNINQSNTWQTVVSANIKAKTIVRAEKTYLPNNNVSNETYNTFRYTGGFYQVDRQYPSFNNPQTCERTDTLVIVRPPVPNYNYSGDTLILGGTTVQIENTSTFADWVSFDFYNGKGEQIGDTIIDTLYLGNGALTVTAYDHYGCISDSTNFNFVDLTNDPSIGLIDSTSSGTIYPVRVGEFTFSGDTDISAMEMHLCDGQTIDLSIDSTMLAFSSGIDSVYYFYQYNGYIDTIGLFGVYDDVSYTIPQTFVKRVDSITTQLTTVTKSKGAYFTAPVYISLALQREPTNRLLNCDVTFSYNQNEFIGQTSTDFQGLNQYYLNGYTANMTSFDTEFRDVNGNIIPYGSAFAHTLANGLKVDTIYKNEITHLPFKGTGFSYYNKISNPQTCILNDTVLVVLPPIAGYTFQGNNVLTFGTPVRHISNCQHYDNVEWHFHDGSYPYFGDTVWHVKYEIGYHDISVIASDIFGCADTLKDYGYIEVMDWNGIEEEQNVISEVLSYPNPMQDNLTLKITSAEAVDVTIFILDMSGRIVLEKIINLVNSENIEKLDVSRLTSGIYNCQIVGKNIKVVQKLIKK